MGWATYSEQILRQVSSLVDAAVHGDEAVHPRLVPHVGVVEAGVQHDDRKGQHVARVWEEEEEEEEAKHAVNKAQNTWHGC